MTPDFPFDQRTMLLSRILTTCVVALVITAFVAFVTLVEKAFPLAQAGEAQAENAAGHTVGKLVVTV